MTAVMEAPAAAPRRGQWRRGFGTPSARIGLAVVGLMYLAGLAAPLLTGHDPEAQSAHALLGPGGGHLLGTDEYGRDLWARVLYGIRVDVLVTVVAVPIGAVLGTALGVLCGVHRWVDVVLQRAFDVMLAFTALILGVTVAAVIGPGLPAVLVTVAGVNVPLFGRIARDAVLTQRDLDYVVAARTVGVGPVRLLLRHILPNGVDGLVVQGALSLSLAVFVEGAMSFVGIGVRAPAPSLGSLLRSSVNFLHQNPAYAVGPMVAVTLLVVAFNLVADGLGKGLLKR
ncbi:ABC transporter permease [Actinomadura rupiterrae]|uniref:ABC transporter permease n=1 Tax=Actinomadura rupiterrae TaxID=559627 RepID=UPI0020A46202|nr:ABC transporter permease [Actinomadura rupiterrae]MCP2341130.1 peptide/nickel transport system permease protein [Actinomadura rupiterrae]